MKYLIRLLSSVFMIFSPFIYSPSVSDASAMSLFYVSTSGNNSNDCLSPVTACATINGAMAKATTGDTILVTGETYTDSGDYVVFIDKNISLSGGWDNVFSARVGYTIIDGQNSRIGIWIADAIETSIDFFTIHNGFSDSGAGGLNNFGTLYLTNTIIENNTGGLMGGGGIFNFGVISMKWSTIRYNNGGGVVSDQVAGPVLIENSTINNNTNGVGVAAKTQNLTIINSTISGNINTTNYYYDGGGISYFGMTGQYLLLRNVTITGNEAMYSGGGIYMDDTGAQVLISNSIIAGNLGTYAADCYGTYNSEGYNIVGDTYNCNFIDTTGDQLDVDPMLGLLQNNGGSTQTHWIYSNSTAIDGGNPAGCLDHQDNPLTIDQRGYTRPLDGNNDGDNICDIGSYEADPNDLPPPSPGSQLFVTPGGDDGNDCLSPITPCQTIHGAVSKSSSNDKVLVSEGTYTKNEGSEVVLIDHPLTISGGWDLAFTHQLGYSTIDGQNSRRGVTISKDIVARLEYLIIYHGFSLENDGGGLYLGYRSRLTASDMIILGNVVGNTKQSNFQLANGGGIGMSNAARLNLNDSIVFRNAASGKGGGLYTAEGITYINNSIINSNEAGLGGGISSSGGSIEITNTTISDNTSVNSGGGIDSQSVQLIINNSTIARNVAGGRGGGIVGVWINIDLSTISGNRGSLGGGIYAHWDTEIRNSSIVYNTSIGSGGGIYSNKDLILQNSTIANNQAFDLYSNEADGGGIYRSGGYPLQASNVTIARNYSERNGGGIYSNYAQITFRNSIISDNEAANGSDCTGNIQSAGYNLVGDTTGCNFIPAAGDLLDLDSRLFLLFGRPGAIALLPDSPAIDGGNPGGCSDHLGNPLVADQLGTLRPIDGNEDGSFICDIGAFEYNPSIPPRWLFLPVINR